MGAEPWADRLLRVMLFKTGCAWILETGLVSSDNSFRPSDMLSNSYERKNWTCDLKVSSFLTIFNSSPTRAIGVWLCIASWSLWTKSSWKRGKALSLLSSPQTNSPPLPSKLAERRGQDSVLTLRSSPLLIATHYVQCFWKENDSGGHHVSNHLARNGTFSFVFLPGFQLQRCGF